MPVSLGGGVLGAGDDVEAAVLGDHPVLLGLRVHHARQPGLLPERVPAASRRCLEVELSLIFHECVHNIRMGLLVEAF